MTDQNPQAVKEFWDRLTAPFPEAEIEKKPQNVKPRDDDKGYCNQGSRYSADGYFCGKYHARSVHLDYVGHAGLTMRLNDVCTPAGWDWQPMATTEVGTPLTTDGGMWIVLTITDPNGHQVSKIGFGDPGRNGGTANGVKETIGDALRNAALRFGIATYLWSKSDRARTAAEHAPEPPPAVSSQFWDWLVSMTPEWSDERRQWVVESTLAESGKDPSVMRDPEWKALWDLWKGDGIPMIAPPAGEFDR